MAIDLRAYTHHTTHISMHTRYTIYSNSRRRYVAMQLARQPKTISCFFIPQLFSSVQIEMVHGLHSWGGESLQKFYFRREKNSQGNGGNSCCCCAASICLQPCSSLKAEFVFGQLVGLERNNYILYNSKSHQNSFQLYETLKKFRFFSNIFQ